MPEPVSAIRNLGPKSVESFARAGLHSAEQVHALGPDETYRRLLAAGSRPHFIGYYALVMGMQGRAWNDLDPAEKAKLRRRFDALVAASSAAGKNDRGRSDLEAALDAFGVGRRR